MKKTTILVLLILSSLAVFVIVYFRKPSPNTNVLASPKDYSQCLMRAAGFVPQAAIDIMPAQLPERTPYSRLYATFDSRGRDMNVLLLYRVSADECKSIIEYAKMKQAAMPPRPKGLSSYPIPSFLIVLNDFDAPFRTEDGFQSWSLYEGDLYINAGVSVRRSDNSVIWWMQRWTPGLH